MSVRSLKSGNWLARTWRLLAAWEEAINTSPIEWLEGRVAALEHEVRIASDRSCTRAETTTGQAEGGST